MGAEIPGDAHIRLVQAEVDSARRDEVELPELARLDQLTNVHDGRAVQERMPGHQQAAGSPRQANELRRLVRARGERLLDEHVLAEAQRLGGKLEVARDRRRNHDRVHPVVREHVEVGGRTGDAGVAATEEVELLGTLVADDEDFRFIHLDEVPSSWPPVAETDDRDAQSIVHRVALGRKTCTGVCSNSKTSKPNDQLRA